MKKIALIFIFCAFYDAHPAQEPCTDVVALSCDFKDKATKKVIQTRFLHMVKRNNIITSAKLLITSPMCQTVNLDLIDQYVVTQYSQDAAWVLSGGIKSKGSPIAPTIWEEHQRYIREIYTIDKFWDACSTLCDTPPKEFVDRVKGCKIIPHRVY